jgi:hypothetical protein
MRRLLILLLVFAMPAAAVELKRETSEAFVKYVGAAEKRMQASFNDKSPFLWMDSLLPPEKEKVLGQLRQGVVVTDHLVESDGGKEIEIPGGMVHHWIGTVFVPGGTIEETMALLQDYDNHKNLYRPEVVDSKLLSRNGNDFHAFLRFYKKKIIGVTLDTEHDAHYERISATRAYSQSHTTKVAEVENAGEKDEREKPIGNDSGFMWALNSYWRIEARDQGVYIQCEAITLTRSIPGLLRPLIQPFIKEVPKESLYTSLNSTRAGLQARHSAAK